ncbi:hypothetical protein ABDI30_23550 [Paenibacillus cisolokensis]|uniref:hypothetical protein n=1 Tax=Paenibacillus cisolokensis TaxID=1658519 RepID=UPI003D2A972A
MEANNADKQMFKKQQAQIEELESRVLRLEMLVQRMAFCKITNPVYPYYEFIVTNGLKPSDVEKLDLLFSLLSQKFNKEDVDLRFKKITDYPTDFLYSDKEIEFIDVSRSIRGIIFSDTVTGVGDDDLYTFELINSLFGQRKHMELCAHLMSKAGFKNNWN